jgi:hypothetical protein
MTIAGIAGIAVLIVVGVLATLLLGLGVARWWAVRAIEEDAPGPGDEVPSRHLTTGLPAGHRPPPGLGPISPSERYLAAEVERGLRDLTAYLAEAA